LDFTKAYDKVSWEILFIGLEKMGMAINFHLDGEIIIPKCLICLNDIITKALEIERRIRQGCPLGPITIYHCWKGPELHDVSSSKIVGNQSQHSNGQR
jgi:hypothetical protein